MTPSVKQVLATRSGEPRRSTLPEIVTSPKNSSAYQVHSYPTKIPPEAIVPFIEASTTPGAIVLDPFCGSGMTGLAAQACGRSAILSDLSPGAVHLARNHNQVASSAEILEALATLDKTWMRRVERELYATTCPTCEGSAVTRHTIWSDVHVCDSCGTEVVLWDEADPENGSVPRHVDCPKCEKTIIRAGSVPKRSEPVFKVTDCLSGCNHLQHGALAADDVRLLDRIMDRRLRYWMPNAVIETSAEMYKRSALHLRGVRTVEDFYVPRAKHALSRLWHRINQVKPVAVRESLRMAFTNTAWHASRMRRYNARGGQRPLTGTLYIPQLSAEANVFEVFRHQVRQVACFSSSFGRKGSTTVAARQSTAASLWWLPDGSIDYVFTDPPFGSNIFYGDCNVVWESWLGRVTDTDKEMVVNRSRTKEDGGKSVDDYEDLLAEAFSEIRRILRPGGRASVVFHNSDDKVWTAMLRAAERADLRQAEVSILDKVQRSMKGYRGKNGYELVPFYDLVITFTPGGVGVPQLNGAGELAIDVVRRHLDENPHLGPASRERSLEFLYSLAVGHVVSSGAKPEGLSYRAFEALCNAHLARIGQHFTTR